MGHVDDVTLNQYVDSTLDPTGYETVSRHLADCLECQERLDELRLLFAALDNVPDLTLKSDLAESIVAQLKNEQQAQRFPRWLPVILAIQAVAALILLIIIWSAAQPVLAEAGALLIESFGSSLEVPSLDQIAQQLTSQLDELSQHIGNARPVIDLPAATWLLLIGLALVAWLVGNGFLLRKSENGY